MARADYFKTSRMGSHRIPMRMIRFLAGRCPTPSQRSRVQVKLKDGNNTSSIPILPNSVQ